MTLNESIAAIPIVIWLYLILARGRFWQVSRQMAPPPSSTGSNARVAVVIPARDEASSIGIAITSLLRQSYQGERAIFVVDDSSTDSTAEIALAAAGSLHDSGTVAVLRAGLRPPGWTGKMWAVSQGIERALRTEPDFLLFTDADIAHGEDSIQTLVSIAEQHSYDLVSWMVKLESKSFAERALIPAFVFFFFLLYPPRWIADKRRKTAGAAGGCILIRPAVLAKAGGVEAIRSELIDDCALARLVKGAGGRVWLGLTEKATSLRQYGSFSEIERMIARTAFNQLKHSPLVLIFTLIGLLLTYVFPAILTFSGRLRYMILGMVAWVLMCFAYRPMVRFYKQGFLWSAALPGIALFYAAATVHSALLYWSGRGGEWKGRKQDVESAA